MLGLGEEDEEIKQVLHDMRTHDVDMLTLAWIFHEIIFF